MSLPETSKKLLSVSAAAKYLGVSSITLRRWDRENKLKARRTLGNSRRYSQEDLDNFQLLQKQGSDALSKTELTVAEAAKILGVTTKTLRNWEKEGKVCSLRDKNNYRVYDKNTVQNLSKANEKIDHPLEPLVEKPQTLDKTGTKNSWISRVLELKPLAQKHFKTAHFHIKKTHLYLGIRFHWYSRWHRFKYHPHIHWLALTTYIIGVFTGVFLVLSGGLHWPIFAAGDLSDSWNFSVPGNYSVSDSNLVDLNGSNAKLKTQNYTTDANTMALFHLDDGSGSSAADSSGNSNAGTITSPSWVTGNLNGALSFDGTSSNISVPDSASLSLSQSNTIEAWTKFNSSFSAGSHSQKNGVVDKGDYRLYFDQETGKVTYELANSAATTWTQQAGSDIKGSWDLNGKLAVNTAKYIGSSLYVGLGNAVGDAEVWKWDGTTWTQIGGDGKNSSWADQTYENVTELDYSGTTLYAGLGSTAGDAEVWSCNTATNCTAWTKIGGDGINSGWVVNQFEEVDSMTVMGGNLYIGLGLTANDSRVYKWNGSVWTWVGGFGIGAPYNAFTTGYEAIYSMANDGTNLYVGFGNTAGDADVWKLNGTTWSQIGGDALNTSWAAATYESVLSMQTVGTTLYAGLGTTAGDAEVWSCDMSTNCAAWTQIGGDSLNSGWTVNYEGVYGFSDDGTNLYAGLGLTAGDNEVWKWDGATWTKIGGDGVNSGFTNTHTIVQTLAYGNSTLFAGLQAAAVNSEMWSFNGSTWTRIGGGYINKSWGFFNLQSVESMVSSGGKLYAGTGNTVAGNAMVWQFDGSSWTLIGGQGLNNSWTASTYEAVWTMTSMGGNLYVGLGSTANDAEVWQWDGATWTKIGGDSLNGGWTTNYEVVNSLTVLNGELYAGLGNTANDSRIYKWNGTSWTWVGGFGIGAPYNAFTTGYENILSMAVYNGQLFVGMGSSVGDADVWKLTGTTWSQVGGDALNLSWAAATYEDVDSLMVYKGELYAGLGISTGDASVWKYDGSAWTKVGGDDLNSSWTTGNYERVRELTTYNGDLYAGLGLSAGDGEVWRYDGTSWTQVGGDTLNSSWANNQVESVGSFSVYQGKLYAGMGDSANVDAMIWSYGNNGFLQSAKNSWDTAWHHVAATYDGSTMKIYVDGTLNNSVSVSLSMPDGTHNLLLGTTYGNVERGHSQGYFEGLLDEIRISNSARSSFTTTPYTANAQTVTPSSTVRTYGVASWNSFSSDETTNGGTITYRLSDDNGSTWQYWGGSSWTSSGSISQANDAATVNTNIASFPVGVGGVKWQAILDGDGNQQVTLNSVTLTSDSDSAFNGSNASAVSMKKTAGGADLNSNDWTNSLAPYFNWTAGSDAEGPLRGYCLYLGQTASTDPGTSKGLLGTSPVSTVGTNCGFIIGTNNIDFATLAYRGGTWLTSSTSPYYLNVKAVDRAGNVFVGSSAQFQFRFDNTLPTNPVFVSTPGNFVASKTVTITWSTSAPNGPGDDDSGLAGMQYRIGNSSPWYGDTHNGNQDTTDLLTNDGSYTTTDPPDFSNLIEGNNTIYFRTWDNAGNVTTSYTTGVIKINTSAPSAPQNAVATPSSNTDNSFAFSWDPPTTFQGSVGNITYCYTVNTLPTANTCTFTAAGVTNLAAGPFANQPGENTFYIVAKDEAANINYATYATATFTANTSAPGVPINIDIADISVKATANWRLAITWEQPSNVGAGVASYKISRSTDNSTYSQVATTSGTSYVDTGLTTIRYYYKVRACDSANNCGAFSSVVNQLPTGKYTEASVLTADPKIAALGTKSVTINWVTDRGSDSRISFGLSPGTYFSSEISNSNQVTDHNISIDNLSAGTIYYYIAKWTDEDGNTGTSSEATFTTKPPPTIKEVLAKNVNLTQATIQFTEKDASKVKIFFGRTTAFGGLKEVPTSISESTLTVELTGLDDGTKYFYKLNSFDSDDNEYDGNVYSFTTVPRPKIVNLRFDTVPGEPTSTMKITWQTNVPTSSVVNYTPSGGVQVQSFHAELKTDHEVVLRGLADDTQYTLAASGRDSLGNLITSDSNNFHTALDTRPPTTSEVTVETAVQGSGSSSKAQLIVSWKTDEPSTSQVEFGEGTSGIYPSKTIEDAKLLTDHIVIISNLSPSKTYHLRAISYDKARNQGASDENSAITGRASENVLDIILGTIRRSLGFLGNFGF